jgi:hypothetical protein
LDQPGGSLPLLGRSVKILAICEKKRAFRTNSWFTPGHRDIESPAGGVDA